MLDAPREADFDDVARFASELCEAPVSLITLLDVDRQFFLSEAGAGFRETPLEMSVCSHAIHEGGLVEVPDLRLDPRTSDMVLARDDEVMRFYAGAVMETDDGVPLGTLCVLDSRPRRLTGLQRRGLTLLAAQIVRQLDLRLALRRGEMLRREIDHRVKNSLQSVAAMVRMQRMRADGSVAAALEVVEGRIGAVASVHEALNVSDEAMHADVARLLGAIAASLRETVPANVALDVASEPLDLPAEHAVAVGMLVNEFVANSVKHAFPSGRAGRVTVRLTRGAEGAATLACEDDGGAPDGTGPNGDAGAGGGTGLGRRIMAAMAGQLNGTLDEGATANGYAMTVAFPLPSEGA